MRVIKFLSILILGIVLIAVSLLWYVDFFSTIKIEEKETGAFTVIYDDFVGDYSKTGDVQNEIYKSLLKDGIETFKGFGIYYDDPKTTPRDEKK